MVARRVRALGIVVAVTAVCGLMSPIGAQARAVDSSAGLPCVHFNPDLGQYGAWVFRPLHAPGLCTEYIGNKPCHCTEAPLSGVRWRGWGSGRAVGVGWWHYCGMGTCTYRRAHLVASRLRRTCGPTYTRLRMRLAPRHLHGRSLPAFRTVFRLPACGGPFDFD